MCLLLAVPQDRTHHSSRIETLINVGNTLFSFKLALDIAVQYWDKLYSCLAFFQPVKNVHYLLPFVNELRAATSKLLLQRKQSTERSKKDSVHHEGDPTHFLILYAK